jgi:hypothetical protein
MMTTTTLERPATRRMVKVSGTAATVLAGLGTAVAPAAAQTVGEPAPTTVPAIPDEVLSGSCSAPVDHPHWSESGQSMDVKARLTCHGVSNDAHIAVYLWLCPKSPPADLNYYWLTEHCNVRSITDHDIPNPADGVTYTRQTPRPGSGIRIPRESGFWVGQSAYRWDGGSTHYQYSAAVKM